jgi:hypothetical protein
MTVESFGQRSGIAFQPPSWGGAIARIAATLLALLAACAEAPAAEPAPGTFTDGELNRLLSGTREEGDPVSAAETLLREIAARPAAVAGLDMAAIAGLQAGLQRVEARAVERRVLDALFEHDWTPAGTSLPRPSAFDVRLALLRLEGGDAAGARAVLAEVWRATDVIDVLIDRRFEPLWGELEAGGFADVVAAVERARAHAAVQAAANPRSLGPVLLQMSALRQAGRAGEAAEMGRAARRQLTRARQQYDDVPAFADPLANVLAQALSDAGAVDRAHDVLREAEGDDPRLMAGRLRSSSANPNQALNAAVLLLWDAQPAEARRRVAGIGRRELTPAGWLQLLAIRACAAAQLGDAEEVAARLAELERGRSTSVEALHMALMCADRLDAAAALTIERLGIENERLPALRMLQIYAAPAHTPPFKATLDIRLAALRARPDVAAAVERVGRVRSWGIVQ